MLSEPAAGGEDLGNIISCGSEVGSYCLQRVKYKKEVISEKKRPV